MSGFPDRPPRVAFGPEMQNKRPPVIPETDLSADQMNLSFWQAAGAGRVLPQALLLFNGATPDILTQALAFDPKQELEDIAFVKNGTGDYTFTFASTYSNQAGGSRPFVPAMGLVFVQGASGNRPNVILPGGQDVQVTVLDPTLISNVDATFLLAVW